MKAKLVDSEIGAGRRTPSKMTKAKKTKVGSSARETITFNCIFCAHQATNPNDLFDHMRKSHPDLCVIPQITADSEIIEEIDEPEQSSALSDFIPKEISDESSMSNCKFENGTRSETEDENTEGSLEEDDEYEPVEKNIAMEDESEGNSDDDDEIESPEMEPISQNGDLFSPRPDDNFAAKFLPPEEDILENSLSDDEMEENDEYSSIMEPICELEEEDEELNYSILDDQENKTIANKMKIQFPAGPGRGRRRELNEDDLENQGDGFFQCTQCEKSFQYAGDLARHVRSHTLNRPFQCSVCEKSFTHIGSLNTHLRIHSGEKPYKCDKCDKSFTQSSSLMVHLRSHQTKKPFHCQTCDKGFVNSSSLLLHIKHHSNVAEEFACPDCDKKFKQEQLLNEHMVIHSDPNLYQCSICRSQFPTAGDLVQHMKFHMGDKPFQCSICEKSFTQPGSLNTHMRIHTGEKPFCCKECGKSFTQASSLSVHMKIHGPDKPFRCNYCNKCYSQQSYFNKHMRGHAQEEKSVCILCSATFEKPRQLQKHIEKVHSDKMNSSLCPCPICNQLFEGPQVLLEHVYLAHYKQTPTGNTDDDNQNEQMTDGMILC